MLDRSSDKEWQRYGDSDPYYGVYNEDKFRAANLDEAGKEAFFSSGYAHIESVFDTIESHIDPAFSPDTALDFGCGVGRLAIPLAERARLVTGLDISESMLSEARKNCEHRSVGNAEFLKSDDELTALSGTYDLVHSFIVLQHIPVHRGEILFKNLVARINSGGVGVLHFTYAKTEERKKLVPFLKRYVPLAKNFFNIRHGRPFNYPHMQMNDYNLNRILLVIQRAGAARVHIEFTDHKGAMGVIVYFRKP